MDTDSDADSKSETLTEDKVKSMLQAANDLQGPKRRKLATGSRLSSLANQDKSSQVQLMKFSYSELTDATNNYDAGRFLGEDENGSVYKGYLASTTNPQTKELVPVAVKKVDNSSTMYRIQRLVLDQGSSDEIDFLGSLQHPSLAKLVGYCVEDDHLLFVNEYMPTTVENHLFNHGHQTNGKEQQQHPFSWNLRLKVALQAAKGLAFLHDLTPNVIHGALNLANIFLDQDFNAKLSDYGLVKNGHVDGETYCAVVMKRGYHWSPEYALAGRLTTKSDVFSFGLILLELVSGLKLKFKEKPDEMCLFDYVDSCRTWYRDKKMVRNLADNMGCSYNRKGAYYLALLIRLCLNEVSGRRPTMSKVVEALELIHEHHQTIDANDRPRPTT